MVKGLELSAAIASVPFLFWVVWKHYKMIYPDVDLEEEEEFAAKAESWCNLSKQKPIIRKKLQ